MFDSLKFTRQIDMRQSKVKVVAILNDVVGVLMTGSYEDKSTDIGIGIGMKILIHLSSMFQLLMSWFAVFLVTVTSVVILQHVCFQYVGSIYFRM